VHVQGLMSDVSARDGTRRSPWYASAIARWTASISVSGYSHSAATAYVMIRMELRCRQRCTYPLKLATHEQNARPHTLLRAVKVALSITEENFGETTEATLLLFINLPDVSLYIPRRIRKLAPLQAGTTTNLQSSSSLAELSAAKAPVYP
jgi:hypothetical protein